jgi:hypothetical protein
MKKGNLFLQVHNFSKNIFRSGININLETSKSETLNPAFRSGLYIIGLIFFTFLLFLIYGHVFSEGLSCADDSFFAVVAKNLAFGKGYSTSDTGALIYFDPRISIGPTMILPASLLIRIFGNLPWVPGFVTATINFILIVLIFLSVRSKIGLFRSFVLITVILIFFYILLAGNFFLYWYSFIGEMPAALFFVWGVFVFASFPTNKLTVAFAGLIFGLAFITKMLTLLGFIPILLWLFIKLIRDKSNRKNQFYCLLYGLITFSAPFILFEIWKLFTLGVTSYLHNIIAVVFSFAKHGAPAITSDFSFVTILQERSKIFIENFGFSLTTLLFIAIIASLSIFYFERQKYIRTVFVFLMIGALLHLLWWVFSSYGWPRYAVIGLMLYFTALSCVIFIRKSRIFTFSIVLLFLIIFSIGNKKLLSPVLFVLENRFDYTPRVKNLLKTAQFLKDYSQDIPFISSWWAIFSDIEYTMPSVLNFKGYSGVDEKDYQRDLILVSNKIWVDFVPIPAFVEWERKCTEVLFDAPPYKVSRYRSGKKYEPGTIINFSNQGNSIDYITFGWSIQEHGCRWTDGPRAGFCYSLDKKPKNDLILQLSGFPYLVKEKIEHQVVTVIANGKNIAKWDMKGNNLYKATLPVSLLSAGINNIIFEISNPIAPVDCGETADYRKLGMAVTKILIEN